MTDMMNTPYPFTASAEQCLRQLTGIVSPTMNEASMRAFLRERFSALGLKVDSDILGNLHASNGVTQGRQIALMAHIDTVALQISSILPNGMCTLRYIGLRPHVALGQPMKVVTANGIVDGVIGFDTTSQYGQPKGLVEEDLWLDLGVSSATETLRLVEIGDTAVLAPRFEIMNDKYLCGAGLDDRVGVLVMLETARLLMEQQLPVGLHFYGTAQEEVGLRGVKTAISGHEPEVCFVLDVDYATDMPAAHENQSGRLALGQGVGVHVKADNNPVLRELACRLALEHDIPYQKSIGRNVYGGTDAAVAQICGEGVATMNVNIPCRYMHSPVEMCHANDVAAAVNMLVETISFLALNPCDLRP